MPSPRERARPLGRFISRAAWLTLALAGLVGCQGDAAKARAGSAARGTTSNILRADYAGSAACRGCHSSHYDAVVKSPMHRMTRDIASTETHARFAGETLELGGDRAQLTQVDGERRLLLEKSNGERRTFRVRKVIGGRYREDFTGVELAADGSGATRGEEQVLPVSALVFDGTLRYKGYSVLVKQRPGLEPGQIWRQTCIFCHNTQPAFVALFDELHGAGPTSYQGSASDDSPPDRRFRYRVSDDAALKAALADELELLGAPSASARGEPALVHAMRETKARFDERHLVELGIGCEACHGGSREHAANPRSVRPTFAVRSPFLSVENADGSELSPALAENRTCAKCHTVLFSRYPHTWEGGQRRREPGGSPINSGEARDFLLGGCRNQLSCSKCHDPHREDPREALDRLEEKPGDALCTGCHTTFADAERARAHTHHPADSAGSRCINCHMPRKNLGLAYELTRYHRIGSPTDRERVEGDRPLECALCHADKSVDQLVSTMERWYSKRYDRDQLRRLYGQDLRIDALRATLLGGLPHEQAVAAAVAARAGRRDLTELVRSVMTSDYPLIGLFAKRAAEELEAKRP